MKKMIWNENTFAYIGTCKNGAVVSVDSDCWDELKAERINEIIEERNIKLVGDKDISDEKELLAAMNLDDEIIDALDSEVKAEFDDPNWWLAIADDNPGVTVLESEDA